MKTIKMPFNLGSIHEISKEAKVLAASENAIVQFEFNGLQCFVDKNTNLSHLWRDIQTAWLMKWDKIGHECLEFYDDNLLKEIESAELQREIENEKQRKEWKKKDDAERLAFEQKTKHLTMDIDDIAVWELGKSNNTDCYGNAIYEYAEAWALLMQDRIKKGQTIEQCANETSFELGFMGITGFMHGASVQILSSTWKYGEELKKWHNTKYTR